MDLRRFNCFLFILAMGMITLFGCERARQVIRPIEGEADGHDGAVTLGAVNMADGPLAEGELLLDPIGIRLSEDHAQVDTWITKWYGPDGNYENNGGYGPSTLPRVSNQGFAHPRDLMAEGTGGKITDVSLSTLEGLRLTRATEVDWGADHGGTRG